MKIGPMIDFDKAQEYINTLGYYQIVTSEPTMDPLEVKVAQRFMCGCGV